MTEPEIKNLLLIGMDVTSLAKSAKRAGYNVCAADYFGDQDLRAVSDCSFSVIQQKEGCSCGRLSADFDVKALLEGAEKTSRGLMIRRRSYASFRRSRRFSETLQKRFKRFVTERGS
jgi:predicted ATP-grasp superfamily ATP-dependent carboligase